MATASDLWRDYDFRRMAGFAAAWLQELRSPPPEGEMHQAGEAVVMMNFTAPPEKQWWFIAAAVAYANSDDELGAIAAGPVEHLLGWHGHEAIASVEDRARSDAKFSRMMALVHKYKIPDDIWERVLALRRQDGTPTIDRQAE